jgi:hypothetical protein
MWDNREKKKNPKAPDFRCKNDDCASIGGVIWPPKTGQHIIKEVPVPMKPVIKTNGQSHPEMLLSYAKDLVVAQIAAGQQIGPISKEVILIYRDLLSEVNQPNSVKTE